MVKYMVEDNIFDDPSQNTCEFYKDFCPSHSSYLINC